ncbi:hypothetical protein [Algibacillus agarilyticus]|nr:hypothetical protein [Algibacillus agarilyticus]
MSGLVSIFAFSMMIVMASVVIGCTSMFFNSLLQRSDNVLGWINLLLRGK